MGLWYDGVSRGAQITGVAVCSLALTWLSFACRLYVRMGLLKFLGREDWLTFAAMIVFTTFCALCLRASYFGLGAHIDNIHEAALVTGFKIAFVCELLYVVSTTITKLSIAAYFLRLSSKRYQRLTVYLTTGVVMIFSSMYFFFLIFQCTPTSYFWTRYGQLPSDAEKCLPGHVIANITYTHSAISAITDWIFGILPIFFVWNIQMNPRTKFSVVMILSLGFFASTATIVRIIYIEQLESTTDYSWEGINLAKWSMIEPAIAITATNIATLRPMFKKKFFFMARKHSSDLEAAKRVSGESRATNMRKESVCAKDYNDEFAELLGLARIGVTTHISAGGENAEKKIAPPLKSIMTFKTGFTKISNKNESQTELNAFSPASQPDQFNWVGAIKATTVVTRDIR